MCPLRLGHGWRWERITDDCCYCQSNSRPESWKLQASSCMLLLQARACCVDLVFEFTKRSGLKQQTRCKHILMDQRNAVIEGNWSRWSTWGDASPPPRGFLRSHSLVGSPMYLTSVRSMCRKVIRVDGVDLRTSGCYIFWIASVVNPYCQ